MCLIFTFKKGNIGIMRHFMHSVEPLLNCVTPEARKRFTFGYKLKYYENGKVIPERTRGIYSLKEAYEL